MDFSRLKQGEIVAAIGGVALFVFMFLDWFGAGGGSTQISIPDVPGIEDVGGTVDIEEPKLSAWDALQDFDGFLIALAAVAGAALGGLAAAGRKVNLGGIPRGAGTALLGSLAVALILWRMLANPGDLEFGIFLGLAAAIAIAVGALLALREDGFEPLVAVAGGRTRAASGAATPRTKARTTASRPATRSSSSRGGRSGGTRAKSSSSRSGSRSSSSRAKSSSRSSSRSTGTRRRATGKK